MATENAQVDEVVNCSKVWTSTFISADDDPQRRPQFDGVITVNAEGAGGTLTGEWSNADGSEKHPLQRGKCVHNDDGTHTIRFLRLNQDQTQEILYRGTVRPGMAGQLSTIDGTYIFNNLPGGKHLDEIGDTGTWGGTQQL